MQATKYKRKSVSRPGYTYVWWNICINPESTPRRPDFTVYNSPQWDTGIQQNRRDWVGIYAYGTNRTDVMRSLRCLILAAEQLVSINSSLVAQAAMKIADAVPHVRCSRNGALPC